MTNATRIFRCKPFIANNMSSRFSNSEPNASKLENIEDMLFAMKALHLNILSNSIENTTIN